MELVEAIAKFRADINTCKAQGMTKIDIPVLEVYLADLEGAATQSGESRQRQHELDLAYYNAKSASRLEGFKSVITAGKEAINAAIIINGGAVIALLSFMGSTIGKADVTAAHTKFEPNYLTLFAFPLVLLGAGVLLGGIAFGTRYVAQFLYFDIDNKMRVRVGHGFNACSWLVTASSLLAFGSAVFLCYRGFLST